MYANVDIRSNDRKRPPYCLRGAFLKIITQSENVCICEDERGERFPAHISKLSQDYVARDLTNIELQLKDKLTKRLKLSKDGKSFIKLCEDVKSGAIDKFDIAESRQQWLDIARMVWRESKFYTTK